ncbi:MAG: hypothetical protein IH589_01270 [Anaerolineales bacterium]|nr:hypothetical protein [Anaerolineales bacterium]
MLEKTSIWFRRFWGVFLGLAVVVGVLTNISDLRDDFKQSSLPTTVSAPSPTAAPSNTPPPTSTPVPTIGPFQFLLLPKQARAGEDCKIILQAAPGSVCHLDYYTPDGNLSTARGLGLATPDSQGKCTWEWHISAKTQTGTAKLVILLNDLQETHEFEIIP